jgi:DNA replication protein DnaC
MENIDFKQIVDKLKAHGMSYYEPMNLHVPNAVQALRAALEYFIGRDYLWLPEYHQVAEWLNDTRGLGLCLYGNNGTGKTVLVQKVIPALLFRYCSKIVSCFNYFDLNAEADKITKRRLLSIDDVGLENEDVHLGNNRWVFPAIMDIAEKRNNIVIFSSNLNGQGFCDKYGVRTFERIVTTTKRIEFNHSSLRK